MFGLLLWALGMQWWRVTSPLNLKIKSSAVKSHAYKAFVRPKLEYASAVWDPHTRTQINQIEKVQRRAARYVTNRYHNTSSVTDMLSLGFRPYRATLKNRVIYSECATLYKYVLNKK